MYLPSDIKNKINLQAGKLDQIGLSDANVYLFEDMVLKIQPDTIEADNEYQMVKWLQDKLPVPQIIEFSKANKYSYLLMSKCEGSIGCSEEFITQPKHLYQLIREALEAIWSIDYTNCPCYNNLDKKLAVAEQNVINGRVCISDAEPETFGPNGFCDADALLYWLINNKPTEELSLSHGDFCLPNMLFKNGRLSGLIDLGRAGIADKWCDIALCYRSIKNNFTGRYPGTYARNFNFNEAELFSVIGQPLDYEKLRYYMLLDELF